MRLKFLAIKHAPCWVSERTTVAVIDPAVGFSMPGKTCEGIPAVVTVLVVFS
ncbi:hypothetical protein ACQPZX_35515 [Actinoplanes sp. CA-142083]|uniref:hypothetical protein n=1 Tax=Actinoplanes sp. CA-142083 TaxID=3239903 RepID=UPI003D8F5BFE